MTAISVIAQIVERASSGGDINCTGRKGAIGTPHRPRASSPGDPEMARKSAQAKPGSSRRRHSAPFVLTPRNRGLQHDNPETADGVQLNCAHRGSELVLDTLETGESLRWGPNAFMRSGDRIYAGTEEIP